MADRELTFGPVAVRYDEHVLAPRPWTVLQATWAAELSPALAPGPMLELCSGAGHIGQAAARWTGRPLVQVDIDPHACAVAEANAAANGLGELVEVRCGDLETTVTGAERFVIVLADPPYLPSDDVDDWPDDPDLAIDGGDDGLDVPRTCLVVAARHVHGDGVVVLQALGAKQVERLAPDIRASGLVVDEVRSHDQLRAVALLRPAARARS